MTKRSYIRIACYTVFALAILMASVAINTRNMNTYRNELELNYQQSLMELSESLDSISTDLTKELYSNSAGEIYDISRDLYAQCATAKNAISRLPAQQMKLGATYKFLSQAGDYAQFIGNKIDKGEKITDAQHKSLNSLLKYCQRLQESIDDMVSIVEAGGEITSGEVNSKNIRSISTLSDGFSNGAKIFDDFPTLLYDGPFSDQVLNKKSELVNKSPVISSDRGKSIVSKALNINPGRINYETDEKGRIPCFTYKCSRDTVSVTKQGGYIRQILYSGGITKSEISEKEACGLALSHLKNIGYDNMVTSYYVVDNNVCTINCAYRKNGVTYYSDLIKVGVSMADGALLTVDANTYLTNHKPRTPSKPKINKSQAQKRVSKYLTVLSSKRCVIPKESGKEVQCYEFTCRSNDTGEEALVYINCDTGDEEDIMLLLKTDNGTLTK